MLKKVYKFVPSNAAADEKPDEDGLTPSMEDFSWERDVIVEVSELWQRSHEVVKGADSPLCWM